MKEENAKLKGRKRVKEKQYANKGALHTGGILGVRLGVLDFLAGLVQLLLGHLCAGLERQCCLARMGGVRGRGHADTCQCERAGGVGDYKAA